MVSYFWFLLFGRAPGKPIVTLALLTLAPGCATPSTYRVSWLADTESATNYRCHKTTPTELLCNDFNSSVAIVVGLVQLQERKRCAGNKL